MVWSEVMGNSEWIALAQTLPPHAPSAELRTRVLAQTSARPEHLVLAEEGEFKRVVQGIAVKVLRFDATTETTLWRLDAGASIPAHNHAHEEECYIVQGQIEYAGRRLGAGDYLLAANGEHQDVIHSPSGALLLIRSERRFSLGK
jgi:anti-sigma factor ChrR (cupin superfamily)